MKWSETLELHVKRLGIRNDINFGPESSRPISSLSTLLFRRSPGVRQDSLPEPYRYSFSWHWDFHQLDSFVSSAHWETPIPSFAWRDEPLIFTLYGCGF
jgi:hypothetical protein